MSCTNCGSAFHERWNCQKPLQQAAASDIPGQPEQKDRGAMVRPAPKKQGEVVAQNDPPHKSRDGRKADRHPPGYQAAKQKLYRERKKAKT